MYTFAKTFTVFLAFLHPIKTHSFAALKVAWLDCAEDSVLPPSTGRSPIILSALGKKSCAALKSWHSMRHFGKPSVQRTTND